MTVAIRFQTVCLALITLLGVGYILFIGKSILIPFALAFVLSILVTPSLDSLRKSPLFFYLKLILGVGITFVLITLLSQVVESDIARFRAKLPVYEENISMWVNHLTDILKRYDIDLDWATLTQGIRIKPMITDAFNSVLALFSNFIVIIFFMIFIIMEMRSIPFKLERMFNQSRSKVVMSTMGSIYTQIQKYIWYKTLISLLTGFLAYIPLKLLNVDFSLLCAFLIFLLNFIPFFGSLIASVVPVMICLVQFTTLWPAIFVAIFLLTLQNVVGNFLEPRLMGDRLNLSPLMVLFSLFFWGSLWGVIGAILAVPLLSIIHIALSNIPSTQPLAIILSNPTRYRSS